ncbi:hypothetical protein BU16DRAFT_555451 [Lophium mytilinum]|uniref:Uncharacterized protein n=1 Tax=Lophium mytilinum TaxID=390894 RepID=A0A6A6R8J6_9PEZI|nr:hypothetical protein BU16DRAFT_555451 [Lophium mytilinum]
MGLHDLMVQSTSTSGPPLVSISTLGQPPSFYNQLLSTRPNSVAKKSPPPAYYGLPVEAPTSDATNPPPPPYRQMPVDLPIPAAMKQQSPFLQLPIKVLWLILMNSLSWTNFSFTGLAKLWNIYSRRRVGAP